MNIRLFYSITIGYILGNLFQAYNLVSISSISLMTLVALGVQVMFFMRCKLHIRNSMYTSFVVGMFLVIMGMLGFWYADIKIQNSSLTELVGNEVQMIGVVKSEPQRKTDLSKVILDISAVEENGKTIAVKNEHVLLYFDFFTNISYGDVILVTGTLNEIKNREAEGNFDFENYAKKDKILLQIFRPEIKIVRNVANPIISNLKGIKKHFEDMLDKFLAEPHSSLLSGMLISGKGALPPDIQEHFIRTGLIHIVVLSGFNIAIIIKFFSALFNFLKVNRKASFVLLLSTLTLFVIIAGVSAPVIRAVLMASVVLLGKLTFRSLSANRVLLFIAFILALINPFSVPFDPSFQLSFLATFAIINLSPIFERYFNFIKSDLLRETVSQTLSATIFVSPFILYLMGNFSTVSVFVNIIILPFVPVLMLFGLLVVCFSFVPIIAGIFAFIVTILSSFVFFIVEQVSNLPFASFEIKNISIWYIVPIYVWIFWFMYKSKTIKNESVFDLTNPH